MGKIIDNSAQIYDVSVPIRAEMPLWPGSNSQLVHRFTKSFKEGDSVNVSRLEFSVHTGTHIDAPYHHFADGPKVEDLELAKLLGPATVYDLSHVRSSISKQDLEALDLKQTPICLLKTENSHLWQSSTFEPNFVHITPEAAKYLISQNVSVVGIDYLSVESFYAEKPTTHQLLFEAGVIIFEGLNLLNIQAGLYYFIGLPIRISGSEGAPARVVLLGSRDD